MKNVVGAIVVKPVSGGDEDNVMIKQVMCVCVVCFKERKKLVSKFTSF